MSYTRAELEQRVDSRLSPEEVRRRIDAMKALLPAPSKRPATRVAVRTPDETDDQPVAAIGAGAANDRD